VQLKMGLREELLYESRSLRESLAKLGAFVKLIVELFSWRMFDVRPILGHCAPNWYPFPSLLPGMSAILQSSIFALV
jgi:hypothetical protein